MSNRLELMFIVDPGGQAQAGINNIVNNINILQNHINQTGQKSQGFLDVFKGNLLFNYFRQATGAVIQFGEESVKAYGQLIQDERFLNSQITETGVNLLVARKNVNALDEGLALSRTNAEKLYATTLQFTKEVGKTDQTNKFIQSLADTLVAHGVSPEQQADITRSLLAGRATELAKVLGKNIVTLEKELSQQAGIDFSQIDDATKKSILFNAVLQEGEKNAGATAARLGEVDGQLASLGAAWDRAKEKAGGYLYTQTLIGDVLRAFVGADPATVLAGKQAEADRRKAAQAAEVAKFYEQLSKGEEIAQGKASPYENFDFFAASQKITPEQIAAIEKTAQEASNVAADAYRKANAGAVEAAEKEARANFKLPFYALQDSARLDKEIQDAKAKVSSVIEAGALQAGRDAAIKAQIHGILETTTQAAKSQAVQLENEFRKLFKPGGGADDLATLDRAKARYDEVKAIFDPADAEEIGDKINAALAKQLDKGLNYLKSVMKAAQGELKTFADENTAEHGDNPFVKIFTDAEESAEKLRKEFGVLNSTPAGQEQLARLQAAYDKITQSRLAAARVDTQLAAERFRNQALELQHIIGLTQAEATLLRIEQARVDAARAIPDLLAKAEALRRGLTGVPEGSDLQKRLVQQQIQGIERQRKGLDTSTEAGQKGQAILDKALTDIYEGLPEAFKRQIARNPNDRNFFASAYERQAGEQNRGIERLINQQAEEERQRAELQKRVDIISRSDLTQSEKDKRILDVTGAVDKTALNPTALKARFDAALRRSEAQENAEAEGKGQATNILDATNNLVDAINELAALSKDPENRRILIEVVNSANARVFDDNGSMQPAPPNVATR